MTKQKWRKKLEARFGRMPQETIEDSEIDILRGYFDHRRKAEPTVFHIDETTWQDLSLDEVYRRVNHTLTSPGDQLLYYWLRTPAQEETIYTRRREMIRYMETHPEVRLRIQMILAKTGKHRAAQTIESFAPSAARSGGLWIALLLPVMLLAAGLCMVKIAWMVPVFFALLILLPAYHIGMTRRLEENLPIANAIVTTIAAYRKIVRTLPEDGRFLTAPYEQAGRRAKAVTRIGGASFATYNDLMLLINNFLLFDLIVYELLKTRISRLSREVSAIHTCVGELDAAIAAASYRKAAGHWCEPDLSFAPDAPLQLRAVGMVHPLLRHPVPNTVDTARCLLITGSNASGKSTFLKAVALNALLAQSIATALCDEYCAPAFHIYSSMALSDDILAGESYFVTEIKAVRRICRAAERGERVLCIVDEVLRGTNTVERIAASSVLLEDLAEHDCLCIAATHDAELCELLRARYALFHFQEQVTDSDIAFDYRLRPGAVCSSNAIRLLGLLGFPEAVTARADERAGRYRQIGKWTPSPQ